VAQIFFLSTCFVISQVLLMDNLTETTTKQDAISPRRSSPDIAPKTAIVYLTKALDECKAIRLGHLLQTVPPNMDVWLLHNHNLMANNDRLNSSLDHVRRLEHEHVLYNASQANIKIQEFDDKSSGAAKSSFLRWVVQHPEYKHTWHMEDDMLFTGEWSHFFAHTADAEADFVGAQFKRISGWTYFEGTRCSMDQTYIPSYSENGSNISLNGRIMCRDVMSWRTLWSITRVSTRFAQFLLEDLESGSLQGHHEAVVQGVLMGHANLTFRELPSNVGYYKAGGWGRFKDRTNCSLEMYQPIEDNRYYHPVKCEAYTGEKLEHFKEIMMTYGWSNATLHVSGLR
jgi:hypothetical protein